ncbi:MAG: recombinase [Methanobacterium sp.]|uniref:ATPase domain-containing protein n=1 Tax=Methanobacterium sp. TaxID=2164 RepID=UPI003D64986C|nr:recombinase [Methanobacterium sp.]
MERIKTGISVFDEITDGFPAGRTMLVTGDAGSGKTIFGLHFAKNSCIEGLKTIYITTEEDAGDLKEQGNSFNWNLDEFLDNGILSFIELAGVRARVTEAEMSIDIDTMKGNFAKILQNIPEDTDVVVIDNLGSYTAKLTPYEFRDRFDLLVYELKHRNITALIILDSATSHEFNELALFSVYGAIKLMKRENPYTGRRERVMDIVKIRSTKTPTQFITYEINNNGIEILSSSEENKIL